MSVEQSTKTCNVCGKQKLIVEFDVDRRSRDSRSYVCKECADKYVKERPPTKVCVRCKVEKPRSEFHAEKRWNGSVRSECKECLRDANNRRYANPDGTQSKELRTKTRDAQFKCRYGITRADYSRMLIDQNGCCAICGTTKSSKSGDRCFYVDHDHDRNVVRGLLCHACNGALGHFGDNLAGIQRVVDYLRRSGDMIDVS